MGLVGGGVQGPYRFEVLRGKPNRQAAALFDTGRIEPPSDVPTVARLRTDLFVLHLAFLHAFVLFHLLLPHLLKLGLLLGSEHRVDLVIQGLVN